MTPQAHTPSAGLIADSFGLASAINSIAALTFISGWGFGNVDGGN